MIKRIVVAGCRDFDNYDVAKRYIGHCISQIRKNYEIIFVSGTAKAAAPEQ